MKTCVIIAAMDVPNLDKLIPESAFVIAADRGYRIAEKYGVHPDLYIGDWDSADMPENICKENIITLPTEKDDTDTHYAAKWAVKNGYESVILIGAVGGRLDHTLANLNTLYYLTKNCKEAKLYSENETIIICRCGCTVSLKKSEYENCYISVFPYGKTASGITETGFKYSLENAKLTADYPLGTSNRISKKIAYISVKNGDLLVIAQKEKTHQI